MRRRDPHDDPLELNVVPLTDVVLLVIIFFMFSTHFTRANLQPMDLPRLPGEPAPAVAPVGVVVEIARDGSLSMGGERVTGPQVVAALKNGGVLTVRADRGADAAHLNTLARTLAGAGVRSWKLATSGEGGN